MSYRFFFLACLFCLCSIAHHINGQQVQEVQQEISVTEVKDTSEIEAIAEIKRRVMLEQYRQTPTVALANMLARATCYVQGVDECIIVGKGKSFQTPEELLTCVRKYTESSKGPCGVKL